MPGVHRRRAQAPTKGLILVAALALLPPRGAQAVQYGLLATKQARLSGTPK